MLKTMVLLSSSWRQLIVWLFFKCFLWERYCVNIGLAKKFEFSHNIVWKNLNKVFGQSSIKRCSCVEMSVLFCRKQMESLALKELGPFLYGLCFSISFLLSLTTPVSSISVKIMSCSLTFKWGIYMGLFLYLNNMNTVLLQSLKYNFGVGGRHAVSCQCVKIISLIIFKDISFLFMVTLKGWGLSSCCCFFFFYFSSLNFMLFVSVWLLQRIHNGINHTSD